MESRFRSSKSLKNVHPEFSFLKFFCKFRKRLSLFFCSEKKKFEGYKLWPTTLYFFCSWNSNSFSFSYLYENLISGFTIPSAPLPYLYSTAISRGFEGPTVLTYNFVSLTILRIHHDLPVSSASRCVSYSRLLRDIGRNDLYAATISRHVHSSRCHRQTADARVGELSLFLYCFTLPFCRIDATERGGGLSRHLHRGVHDALNTRTQCIVCADPANGQQ